MDAVSSLPAHRNIVAYYRAWQQNAHFYIQMQLCEGGSLADLLEEVHLAPISPSMNPKPCTPAPLEAPFLLVEPLDGSAGSAKLCWKIILVDRGHSAMQSVHCSCNKLFMMNPYKYLIS